jgi:hypothetical protein
MDCENYYNHIATAGSAFLKEACHMLGKLCLFTNFLGCNSSVGRLGDPEVEISPRYAIRP